MLASLNEVLVDADTEDGAEVVEVVGAAGLVHSLVAVLKQFSGLHTHFPPRSPRTSHGPTCTWPSPPEAPLQWLPVVVPSHLSPSPETVPAGQPVGATVVGAAVVDPRPAWPRMFAAPTEATRRERATIFIIFEKLGERGRRRGV